MTERSEGSREQGVFTRRSSREEEEL